MNKKLICPSGKSFSAKVSSITRSILRCEYHIDPVSNLKIQEEEIKKSLRSLLDRAILY